MEKEKYNAFLYFENIMQLELQTWLQEIDFSICSFSQIKILGFIEIWKNFKNSGCNIIKGIHFKKKNSLKKYPIYCE